MKGPLEAAIPPSCREKQGAGQLDALLVLKSGPTKTQIEEAMKRFALEQL
jgi:hypothetical protein